MLKAIEGMKIMIQNWPGTIQYLSGYIVPQLLLLVLLSSKMPVHGKENKVFKFKAKNAQSAKVNGERCIKLSGDVRFQVEQGVLYAPAAFYFDKRNFIRAEGGINLLLEKDGISVEATQFTYDEKTAIAQLQEDVVFVWKSKEITLYANHLKYDLRQEALTFEGNVRLISKDYRITCDTLHYNTVTEVVRFKGSPANIVSQDGKQALETNDWGEYNTASQQSAFSGGMIETEQYKLYGAKFVLDQAKEVYKVTGVRLVAKEEDIEIAADHAEYQKKKGIAKLYGNALMKKVLNDGPLYLSADNFVATEDRVTHDRRDNVIKAFPNVKIYKEGFQGKSDAVVYKEKDARFDFEGDTVFWTGDNQLTAEKSYVVLKEKMLHEMHMETDVMVVAQDKGGNFNQLLSKQMITFFHKNTPTRVELSGNVESLYHLLNGKDQLEGVSHLKCSQVQVGLVESKISKMTIPGGACSQWEIHPPDKLPKELKELANFSWRITECPTQKDVIGRGYGTHEGYPQFKLDNVTKTEEPRQEKLKK